MPAPHYSVFKGRMPFLPPNQQHQSTEGTESGTGLAVKSIGTTTAEKLEGTSCGIDLSRYKVWAELLAPHCRDLAAARQPSLVVFGAWLSWILTRGRRFAPAVG